MKWSLNLARRTDESICAAHIVDEHGISVAQLALHDEQTILRNADIICKAANREVGYVREFETADELIAAVAAASR